MSEGSPPKNTRRRETVVGAGTAAAAVRPRPVAGEAEAEAEAEALEAARDARLEEAFEPVETRLDLDEDEEGEGFRSLEAGLRFLEAKGSVAPCAVGRFREKGSDITSA